MGNKHTFFWKDRSPFSQWYPSTFVENGNTFKNAEMYMMYEKALLFGDQETAQKILKADHPSKAKKLGREVKGFNPKKWDEHKLDIVIKGNYLKFTQKEKLKEILLSTEGTRMVEASPYDKIWGIGLDEDDAKKVSESSWPGENLLGKALDEVRTTIINSCLEH